RRVLFRSPRGARSRHPAHPRRDRARCERAGRDHEPREHVREDVQEGAPAPRARRRPALQPRAPRSAPSRMRTTMTKPTTKRSAEDILDDISYQAALAEADHGKSTPTDDRWARELGAKLDARVAELRRNLLP